MVHALKCAHGMMLPEGLLIEVHDLPMPHLLQLHADGEVFELGWITDSEDFDNERRAFAALDQVVSEGVFEHQAEREFQYAIHADGIDDLLEWMGVWWQTAVVAPEMIARSRQLAGEFGEESETVLRVSARMSVLAAR